MKTAALMRHSLWWFLTAVVSAVVCAVFGHYAGPGALSPTDAPLALFVGIYAAVETVCEELRMLWLLKHPRAAQRFGRDEAGVGWTRKPLRFAGKLAYWAWLSAMIGLANGGGSPWLGLLCVGSLPLCMFCDVLSDHREREAKRKTPTFGRW